MRGEIAFLLSLMPYGQKKKLNLNSFLLFDHFLMLPTTLPDHFQTISRQSVDTPPIFRTITAPSPHLFRYNIAENLRRRCGDRAEMVRRTPSLSPEYLVCFWFLSGSHPLMIFFWSFLGLFLVCLFFNKISLKMSVLVRVEKVLATFFCFFIYKMMGKLMKL